MNETINKVCKKHGVTEHVKERGGYFRCKRCRNDYVIQRRRNVKLKLVEDFGGGCKVCQYNRCIDNLIFHHLDPTKKDFAISSSGNTYSYNKLKKEADKCILLCCRCHGELHAGLITI